MKIIKAILITYAIWWSWVMGEKIIEIYRTVTIQAAEIFEAGREQGYITGIAKGLRE